MGLEDLIVQIFLLDLWNWTIQIAGNAIIYSPRTAMLRLHDAVIGLLTVTTIFIPVRAFVLSKPCHRLEGTKFVPNPIRIHRRLGGYRDRRKYIYNHKNNDDDEEEWVAGDVYKDLDRLEQAINFANAEQNLAHQERLETLDFIAEQRRPIMPDIVQYIIRPLALSFFLATVLQTGSGRIISRLLNLVSAVHFWGLVVTAPLFFLLIKRVTTKTEPVPAELGRLDPQYLPYLTTIDWEDPKSSCRDFVLCLLEQWSSAVIGVALTFRLMGKQSPMTMWMIRILVRLGSYSALHQYPKQWYELFRKGQPRPIPASVHFMQSLVHMQKTPWFIAIDLALLTSAMGNGIFPWWRIVLGYSTGLGTAALAGVATNLVTPRFPIIVKLVERRPPIRTMLKACGLVWLINHRQNIWNAMQRVVFQCQNMNLEDFLIYFPWRKFMKGAIYATAIAGPIFHLYALQKIWRVAYTHSLSLAMDVNAFRQSLSKLETADALSMSETERKNRLLWRWKLAWREPQRILVTLNHYRKRFWYWLFFSGSVAEKLRILELEGREQEEAAASKLKILQRVAEDIKRNPDAPLPDRTQWKQNAMDALADRHQKDYETWKQAGDTAKLERIGDPLGIAVKQAIGIGLGFNFDHMSKSSSIPLTRRLQARAAKSAVKRVQALYNADKATKELDNIDDPVQRELRAKEMRETVDNEISLIAERLSNLIPTDLSLPFPGDAKILQFNNKDNYQRTSENEFVLSTPYERSPVIENLKKRMREKSFQEAPDYLNPWGNESQGRKDDEFITEWMKRSENPKLTPDHEEDQEDDSEIETYLA